LENDSQTKCPHCQEDLILNPQTGNFECVDCRDQEYISKANLPEDYKKALKVRFFYDQLNKVTPKVFVYKILLQLNIAVFALIVLQGADIINPSGEILYAWGANYGPSTVNGQWWRLLSSMFLHGGVLHLAFNMYALKILGPIVEKIFGNVGFLLIYLFSGLCGSFASVYSNTGSSVGASGAICGIFGALIGFMVFKRSSIPKEISSSIFRNAALVILLNAFIGFGVSQIDNSAHLGGLLSGFVVVSFMGLSLKGVTSQRRQKKNISLVVLAVFLFMIIAPYLAVKVNAAGAKREVKNEASENKIQLAIDEFNKYEVKLDKDFLADTQILDIENDSSRQFLLDKINGEILPLLYKKCKELLKPIESAPKGINPAFVLYIKKYIRLKTDYFIYWQLYLKTQDEKNLHKAEQVFKKIKALESR
jgi:membrane associated rhomboid family serine protease